ncbi:MAG: hypothetical protein QW393_03650, partial [Candidatus Micrarchaeaceae archaeon]
MIYPITISGAPSGSGYYQQMITLSNPSQYGISPSFSNFYVTTSSGTPLYMWIESANSSKLVMWTKMPNGTASADLEVFGSNANLLSSTGYLGEAPQLSSPYNASNNAFLVFGMGYFFSGTTLNSLLVAVNSGATISQDNGLTISTNTNEYAGAYLNVNYNASKYELVYNAYYSGTSTTPPSIIGPILGFGSVGSAGGLSEGDNEYQAVAYNGTNHESSPIPMSTTSYNNFIYWLSGTTVNIQYNGITYSVGGNYQRNSNSSFSFELLTYNNTLHINYVIPVVKLPNGMPTYSIGSGVASQNPDLPNGTVQYYQQLFTLSNPSQYGINSQGSNILFSLSNGTNLYAWIQSINSSSMSVWVKIPYGTSTVNLNVYPQFENLFSATGYLGEAPQLSSPYNASNNAFLVFGRGYFFTGTTLNPLLVVTSGTTISQDNGLTISTNSATFLGAYLNVNYNASKYEIIYNAYYSSTNAISPSSIGPILGFGSVGSAGGLSEGDNEYQAIAFNGTNHESSPIPMSTTSYNNFIYWLSGTTVNIQYNGITYSVGGNYPYSVNGSYPFELYTYDNTLHINYIIPVVKLPNGMPTYSIGSPSVFQAAGTTSSSFSGISGQAYNSTWNYFSYNIPVAPSASYVTIIYNSSWLPFNVFPSSYVLFKNDNLITIENVTGYSSVQVSFIEPSQLIGTNTYDTISYNAPPGIVLPSSGYINAVTYQPSGSSKLYTITTTSDSVSIPYGSNVSVKVYNPWRQVVGQVSGYQIYNLSSQISIFLNVSQINFQFFNGSPQYVFLSANGYNISFLNSAVVANGSEYFWSTSYYSFSTGLKQYMSGEVTPNRPQVTVDISLNAPPADLEVSVIAYSGSNLGSIGTTGSPRVVITISGNPYSEGSTFIGSEGQTYNIRISTVLGQLLYETNVTLSTSFVSVTEVITVPSYTLGIENEEQVPQSSPLSTEYVSVNDSAGQYYNFTDGVGQNEVLYLLAGNYHIYMKDNLTGNFNISLIQNSQLYAFGQQLLTYQEFQAEMQELANNTAGLVLNTISSPFAVQPQQSAIYQLSVYYTNGTAVTASFLQKATINVLITNDSSGTPVSFVIDHSSSQNTLNVTVIPDMQGNFTISIMVLSGSLSGHVSYQLKVQKIVASSLGMQLEGAGPSTVSIYGVWNYTVSVNYANGTRMNLNDTRMVYNNMTISIFNGIDPIQAVHKVSYTAGIIIFNVTFNQTGGYTLYIESHADIQGYASATALIPVLVTKMQYPVSVSFSAYPQALNDTQQIFTETVFSSSPNMVSIAYNNSQVLVYSNNNSIASIKPYSYNGNNIFFKYIFLHDGTYTLILTVLINGTAFTYSAVVSVYSPVPESIGMKLIGSGSPIVTEGQTYNYTVLVEYQNSTPMSSVDTGYVYANMSVTPYSGIDPSISYHKINYYPGIITFNVTFDATGSFTLYIYSSANISGQHVVAGTLIGVQVNAPVAVSNGINVRIGGSQSIKQGTTGNYVISLYYLNGTSLSLQDTAKIVANLSYTVLNGTGIIRIGSYSSGLIYFYFTSQNLEDAILVFSSHADIPNAVSFSIPYAVTVTYVSPYFNIEITGPPEIEKNTTSMYLISLLYSNGSRLNANATRSLIPDMNISVLLNGKYYG